eukprot:888332-Pelagomonas_calceolata.AAC.1
MCLQPPLATIPKDEWICPRCVHDGASIPDLRLARARTTSTRPYTKMCPCSKTLHPAVPVPAHVPVRVPAHVPVPVPVRVRVPVRVPAH